eukprot:693976-Alexandrium_andersonii.AAC.1
MDTARYLAEQASSSAASLADAQTRVHGSGIHSSLDNTTTDDIEVVDAPVEELPLTPVRRRR